MTECMLCGKPAVAVEALSRTACADCLGIMIRELPAEVIATLSSGSGVRVIRTRSSKPPGSRKEPLRCTFCDMRSNDVEKLIAGPNVHICDKCVDLCVEILEEEGLGLAQKWIDRDAESQIRVVRSVTPLQEYFDATILILGRVPQMLSEQHPGLDVTARLEFEGAKLRLVIGVAEHDRDRVLEILEAYGTAVHEGRVPLKPDAVTTVPEAVREALAWILRGEVEDVPGLFEFIDP